MPECVLGVIYLVWGKASAESWSKTIGSLQSFFFLSLLRHAFPSVCVCVCNGWVRFIPDLEEGTNSRGPSQISMPVYKVVFFGIKTDKLFQRVLLALANVCFYLCCQQSCLQTCNELQEIF
uniref:Putative secreted protein n=1 Tax=Ixodes ricinus TaxID=34613 RepID=A0A6B0UND5_IXORI